MKPTTVTIETEDDLSVWTADIADNLSPQEGRATVIGLIGPLGVGKTAFTRSLLEAYGVTDAVTSPTYTIETVYKLPQGPFTHGYHIDAYRLDGPEDLEALDFQTRLQDESNLIIIEWAEEVADLLPEDILHIDMSFSDDDPSVDAVSDEPRQRREAGSEKRVMKLFYE